MMASTTQYLNLHIADQRENILLILHFSFSGTKIRKVESKTKKIISFFAETEYLRHLPDGNVLANEQAPQASSDEKTRAGQ
ncbi:MAG: hypothetical protein II746_08550, partial [Bacteroidaceae bacterium]|nr:hypothetical protein [Bacteroidaceae bacterium]